MRTCFLLVAVCLIFTVKGHFNGWPFKCTTRNGEVGICMNIYSCYSAIFEIRRNRLPEICGYDGTYPMVCCIQHISNKAQRAKQIGLQKCKEYSKYKWKFMAFGRMAKILDYPHMVVLGFQEGKKIDWKCGGSLISGDFVLTAAHCVYSAISSQIIVRIGEINISEEHGAPRDFGVDNIYIYPKYKRSSKYHDIALLRLDRQVEIGPDATPVCLGVTRSLTGRTVEAIGWGATEFGGEMSNYLQSGSMNVTSGRTCKKMYGKSYNLKQGIVEKYMVCAYGGYRGPDACQGDSGGPLLLANDYRYREIVGVTSFGKKCGLTAGVYTRVYTYAPWIEKIVWPDL